MRAWRPSCHGAFGRSTRSAMAAYSRAPTTPGGRGVGLRERLRKLEEAAEREMIIIPQRDGTVSASRNPPARRRL